MVLDGFSRRKVVQGHAGDVPMHRLPAQLLLSSEIRYFPAGTPSRNSPEFRRRNSGEEGLEGMVMEFLPIKIMKNVEKSIF